MDLHLRYLGDKHNWGAEAPFALAAHERAQHVYVVGKTGVGKSTLLRNIIIQDIAAGAGVGLIDPHGDLACEILSLIPPYRTDDVVYLNTTDVEFPVGFNFLHSSSDQALLASGVVSSMKSIWRESWGPRLEYILYSAVAALQECQGVSILSLQRMLHDEAFRIWVVKQVKDPIVRGFWDYEFENYEKRSLSDILSPIQNKVGQLIMSRSLRNILGQIRNRVDLDFIMNRGRILIANLAKGALGEDKSNLLGSMLVSQFQLAAMRRSKLPEDQRLPFYLFVDEFQNFSSDNFASILSEARKFGLSLTLSHQYTSQLRPEIRDAVFGNVGTLISFRVGATDAEHLAHEMSGKYLADSFTSLGAHEIIVKMPGYEPFSGKTYPPLGEPNGRADNIIKRSRERYATPRAVVEEKIERWIRRCNQNLNS